MGLVVMVTILVVLGVVLVLISVVVNHYWYCYQENHPQDHQNHHHQDHQLRLLTVCVVA